MVSVSYESVRFSVREGAKKDEMDYRHEGAVGDGSVCETVI